MVGLLVPFPFRIHSIVTAEPSGPCNKRVAVLWSSFPMKVVCTPCIMSPICVLDGPNRDPPSPPFATTTTARQVPVPEDADTPKFKATTGTIRYSPEVGVGLVDWWMLALIDLRIFTS